MVRLEINPETEKIKSSLAIDPQKIIRKTSFRFNCCLILFFLLLSFLIIVLAVVTKIGIVDIPLFSKIFYQSPQPTRLLTFTTQDFEKNLNLKIIDNLIYLEISESQLTYLVNQGFARLEKPFLENIQLVITNNLIELSAKIIRPFKTDVILKIKPILKEEAQFNLELIEARLGNLLLPPFLANKIFASFIEVSVDNLNESFNKIGQLKDLKLKEGRLIIVSQYEKGL